jgi:hypothetical protein
MMTIVCSDRRDFIKTLISNMKALIIEFVSVKSTEEEVEGFGLAPDVDLEVGYSILSFGRVR